MARALRDSTVVARLRLYESPESTKILEENVPWFATLIKEVSLVCIPGCHKKAFSYFVARETNSGFSFSLFLSRFGFGVIRIKIV